jgi:hypothetical protein
MSVYAAAFFVITFSVLRCGTFGADNNIIIFLEGFAAAVAFIS